MNLNPQELAKIRKVALYSVTLSSDMRSTVVDVRLKELTQAIKKYLLKKDIVVEVIGLRIND
jgi:hypothetical protein